MMNLADHTTGAGSILNLDNLTDFVKTKRKQCALLILWNAYTASNLLYFNCCH